MKQNQFFEASQSLDAMMGVFLLLCGNSEDDELARVPCQLIESQLIDSQVAYKAILGKALVIIEQEVWSMFVKYLNPKLGQVMLRKAHLSFENDIFLWPYTNWVSIKWFSAKWRASPDRKKVDVTFQKKKKEILECPFVLSISKW